MGNNCCEKEKSMNEVFHVTKSVNVNSILKHGLLCSKPTLEHHEDAARRSFDNYNERGLIYTIPYGCNRMDKYLKDTAYWRVWGRPRNDILALYHDYDVWIENKNCGVDVFKEFDKSAKYEDHFSILSIMVPDNIEMVEWIHVQDRGMSAYWLDMNFEFEHCNKPLFMFNQNLKCQIHEVGTIEVKKKRKKIEVSLRR